MIVIKQILRVIFHILDAQYCVTETNEVCDFPFNYKGEKFASCLDVDNGGQPWCYTNTSSKEWNNCNSSKCLLKEGKKIKYLSVRSNPRIFLLRYDSF